MTLRPYQRALVGGLHRAVKEGADAVLMQSPTGSGKTSTIAEGVILPSLAQGRRFVFAAHLEELLDDPDALEEDESLELEDESLGRESLR